MKKKKIMKLENPKICKNTLSQAKGLIFSKKINKTCLVFVLKKPKKVNLHMWFVFFPIDVLYLDETKKILEMKEDFRPFAYYVPKNKAKYIVELPFGTITQNSLKKGSFVEF